MGLVDGVQRQLTQSLTRLVFGEHASAFVHSHKPLCRSAVDDRGFVTPAMGVAVGNAISGHEAIAFAQHFNDSGASFPNVHAAKQWQVFGVAAVALNGVQDVVVGHAIGHARVKVIDTISRG